jgi:hypothetical protein
MSYFQFLLEFGLDGWERWENVHYENRNTTVTIETGSLREQSWIATVSTVSIGFYKQEGASG